MILTLSDTHTFGPPHTPSTPPPPSPALSHVAAALAINTRLSTAPPLTRSDPVVHQSSYTISYHARSPASAGWRGEHFRIFGARSSFIDDAI